MISLLFVDGDENLHFIRKKNFEKGGIFLIDTSRSPIEALEKINSVHYDAIISDYNIPEMDGISFLKEVRLRFGDIPFIFFFGKGQEDLIIQAINNGADFYIRKIDEEQSQFTELSHLVNHAVRKRETEQSLADSLRKLKIAYSRYEALITASNTGAWEYHHELDRFWASPEYFSMLGRDNWCYGITDYHNITQTWSDLLHPDEREQVVKKWNEYRSHPVGIYQQNFRMLHLDGHWVWILSRGKTVHNTSGNNTPITIGTHIDVTEQKRVEEDLVKKNEELRRAYDMITVHEEELRRNFNKLFSTGEELKKQYFELQATKNALQKSEKKYRSIFEDAILGIFQTNPEGLFIKVNPAFSDIYGYESPEEMINTLTDIRTQLYTNPEDRDMALKTLYEKGEIRGFETKHYRKDGASIWISMNSKIIWDDHGKIRFFEGTIEDITRRKKAEEENELTLQQIRRNLAELSILNDGIRNPLTIINILAETVGLSGSEKIIEQVRRIDDLVRQLDKRWLESDKIIHYLQKYHDY